jgi:hypothetical protein
LVFGRNADYYSSSESFANRTCVIVYNPDDGSNSVASVCSLGQLQVPTGLNDKGIFMEWNEGSIYLRCSIGYLYRIRGLKDNELPQQGL